MQKKIFLLGVITVFCQMILFAQEEELLGFDFTYVGKGNVKDDYDSEISIQRYDLRAMLPMATLKGNTYLMNELNFASSNIHYGTSIANDAKLNQFHTISYSLSLMTPLKNNWNLYIGAGPYVSSNFDSGLKAREVQFTGVVMFFKEIGTKKQLELTCGLFYHPSFGAEVPLPLVGIKWKPNQKWVMSFGFPECSIDYNLTKNSALSANLFITGDIYTLSKDEKVYRVLTKNIQGDVVELGEDAKDEEVQKVNRLRYADYGIGLKFKQKLFKNFQFRINSGYTFYRKLEFIKGTKKLYDTNTKDKLFVQAGVSFLL